MRRSLNRAERLQEMERLYFQRGYSDIEMAERLGVDRTTVFRDRTELETQIPFVQQEDGRYRIDRTQYLSSIRLNLNEALALYLAARRASQQTRSGQPHTASALEKLALALRQPMTSRLVQAADRILAQQNQPERLKILETITQAWVEGRQVRFSYRGLHGHRALNYRVDPYLIEPSPWSDGVYLIGRSDVHGEIAVFKTDRIETASLSQETFDLPQDFSEDALLKYAWGIWLSEREPYTVTLRFAAGAAARRLGESIWHPTQVITPLPEGGCLWQALVAEWQEMLPWVRGWGADVEVLEPGEMREALVREAERLVELYKIMEKKSQLIAHIREKDKTNQSLYEHLLSVSKIAGEFASKIGMKEAGEILGLLHDFGKASQQFQLYLLSGEGVINPDADGYINPQEMRGKIDHSTAGAQLIYDNLWNNGSKEKIAAQVFALCIASHHSGLIDCLTPNGENNFIRRMEKADQDTHKTEALSNLHNIETIVEGLISQEVIEKICIKLSGLQEGNSDSKETLLFKYGLFIRFLFSCLIDADRLDTADFETPYNTQIRNYGRYHSWDVLIQRFDNKLKEFENKTNKNEVDELRNYVSQACFDFAVNPKGIYQLTVPTGGGKTLASLRFALNHVAYHSMTFLKKLAH